MAISGAFRMRDIALKYKFWLVNIISFVGMAVLSLYAISSIADAMTAAGKATSFGSVLADHFLGFGMLVFVLMLAVMGGSQLLILFVERHIAALSDAMLQVQRDHDLTRRVRIDARDEVGQMAGAFNDMQAGLQRIVNEVNTCTSDIRQAVEHLTDITNTAHKDMREQHQRSNAIEDHIREMASSVQTIQQQVGRAHELSRDARQLAENGNTVVRDVVLAFQTLATEVEQAAQLTDQLSQDSANIGNVLNVIRGIADQTNLLALNAAIEAARAGESGRGFAVVADEVRKLAQRAQEATDEIRKIVEALQGNTGRTVSLMTQSAQRAQDSREQAESAGQALAAITASVEAISQSHDAIAGATGHQAQMADRVVNEVGAIRGMTEKTLHGTEQSATSTQQLWALADRQTRLVGKFRT